jgi:uncharacterized protein (TIGR00297 family)
VREYDGKQASVSGSSLSHFPALPPLRAILAGVAASGAVGLLAYRRGSLSASGVAGAVLTGTTIFAGGGAVPSAALLTFFVSSSLLSHWRKGRKAAGTEVEAAKGERRDLAQTFANGGVAAALVVLGRVRPETPCLPALVGALATVNADTWATEIGLLSRRQPRLVTSLRTVPPGTSGGITPLGTGAAALGATLIGAVAAIGTRRRELLPLALVAGLAGSFADSLLGATVQARYRCPLCDVATERTVHRCGAPTTLVGGWRFIDNDVVNFAASVCGAMIGWMAP